MRHTPIRAVESIIISGNSIIALSDRVRTHVSEHAIYKSTLLAAQQAPHFQLFFWSQTLIFRTGSAALGQLKQIARRFGVNVNRFNEYSSSELRLAKFLGDKGVTLVIDVGANRGQFAKSLFGAGYGGRIVSVEPLPAAHHHLTAAAERHGPAWTIAERTALSDTNGEATLHVSEADASSSLLAPTERLIKSLPQVATKESISVQTRTLQSVIDQYVSGGDRVFLKLDVQGSEATVLNGAQDLSCLVGIMTELSIDSQYTGQATLADLEGHTQCLGMTIWDVVPVFWHPNSFRIGACDLIYFRD